MGSTKILVEEASRSRQERAQKSPGAFTTAGPEATFEGARGGDPNGPGKHNAIACGFREESERCMVAGNDLGG